MSLYEIEQKIIRPLSRAEKLQLIADITKMLQEEEGAEQAFPQDFRKGNILPVFTPSGMEETAARLQEYIDINKQIQKRELDGLLEEGYKANRREDTDMTEEFQSADSEGWDEY